MQSFGNAEFRPIPRTPLGRDLKVFIDPRNNRGRNILFVGSIFLVVYTYVITFIQNRIGKIYLKTLVSIHTEVGIF